MWRWSNLREIAIKKRPNGRKYHTKLPKSRILLGLSHNNCMQANANRPLFEAALKIITAALSNQIILTFHARQFI